MSENAASGNGIPESGSASGNAGEVDAKLAALVNETINKALGSRLARMKEELVAASKPVPTKEEASDSAPATITMKALQAQMEGLRAELSASKAREKDGRARSEVQAKLAARIGADNPLLGTVMDSLYDVKKRFVEQPDGRLAVRFQESYGEDFKPLDEGVEALFQGELKHLLPTKTQGLPMSVRGLPISSSSNGRKHNPLDDVFREVAAGLAQSGVDVK